MKVLALLSRVPWPLDKGDKLRAFHLLRHLAGPHQVYLICLSGKPIADAASRELDQLFAEVHILRRSRLQSWLQLALGVFSRKPFQVLYFHQKRLQRQVDELIERIQPDHVYCQLVRCAEYVRHLQGIHKTLDYMDALSKGMQRRQKHGSLLLRPFVYSEARRLRRYERAVFSAFDHHTIITQYERQFIDHPLRDNITVIANGVDGALLAPQARPPRFDILFHGNLSYEPNVQCALYIARHILPRLRRARPSIRILISGATPCKRVRALTRHREITISGWVADLRETYAAARLFLAPMLIGSGLQNKLLEAMAARLPCVISPLANQALGARSGREVLVASTPEEFTRAILHLFDHPDVARQQATAALEFVRARFNWQDSATRLENLLQIQRTTPHQVLPI
ncbi:MAG: glycosyltransferase [Steroidobacteraceae bacterium]